MREVGDTRKSDRWQLAKSFLKELKSRPVRLGDLPRHVKVASAIGLAACVAAGTLIVTVGGGLGTLGGSDPIPVTHAAAFPAILPRLVIAVTYLGLGAAAGILILAAGDPRWRLPRLTGVAVGFVGAALCGMTIAASALVKGLLLGVPEGSSGPRPLVPQVLGWIGLAIGLAVMVVGIRLSRRSATGAALLAAAPFVCAFIGYFASGTTAARVQVQGQVFSILISLEAAADLLLLWLAVAAVSGALRVGSVVGRAERRWERILPLVLGFKLVWVISGIAGVLPAWLGGRDQSWASSRHDGVASWLLAALLVVAALWLLIRSSWISEDPIASNRAFLRTAWGLILALSAVSLLLSAGFLVVGFLQGVWPSGAQVLVQNLDLLVDGHSSQWGLLATVYASSAAGVVLLVTRRARFVAVFLLAFAAWTLPRALVITRATLSDREFSNPPGFVDLVSLDAVLTAGILVAAVLWWAGRQRAVSPEWLTVALVVSTLFAHAGTLFPVTLETSLFYGGLVFPVAFAFLWDTETLNEPSAARRARILGTVGVATALLTITLAGVATDSVKPGTVVTGEFGRVLLAVPLAAVLIASYRPRPTSLPPY